MYVIWRNLKSIVRRFKIASLLNLLGLSVALAAFMVIMMQVWHDYTFDACQPDRDCIARLDFHYAESAPLAITIRPFARAFVEFSPEIEAGVLFSWPYTKRFQVEDGDLQMFQESFLPVTDGLQRVFHFDMLEGSEQALDEPNSVMLPASLSKKLFGEESPIGKTLIIQDGSEDPKIVRGVYRDLPLNSSLQNVIYMQLGPVNYDNWDAVNYQLFVRVHEASRMQSIVDRFKEGYDVKAYFGNDFTWGTGLDLRLDKLRDLHFMTQFRYDNLPKADRTVLWILFSVAFLILVVAVINFTNFITAIVPLRIRSINTQKVLGSSDKALRRGLLVESMSISLGAFLLSLYWFVALSKLGMVSSLVTTELSLLTHWTVVLGTALLALAFGLVAGLYPAFYVTSFPPALVLKGNFGLSPSGRRIRSVLVGVQYIASFALVIGALFMYLQNEYMLHYQKGYRTENRLIVTLNEKINQRLDSFAEQLEQESAIEKVSFMQFVLGVNDDVMRMKLSHRGQGLAFQYFPVDYNFLSLMDIPVREGRDFRMEDRLSDEPMLIFNQTAKKLWNLEVGDKLENFGTVVGFVDDVNFASLRREMAPMCFYMCGQPDHTWYNCAIIKYRTDGDTEHCMDHLQAILKEFDPDYTFPISSYEDELRQAYQQENHTTSLITLFSLVAITLAIVGVFGLVLFDSEYRRKEIALRRVMGASVTEILLLFNRNYFRILLVCFVLGSPLAWYFVQRWLENFAYRTPMYWWVLPVVFLLVAGITALTVTYQNWHVAHENPANNIKTE